MTQRDLWAEWLLHRRHGGDEAALKSTLEFLGPIKRRILDQAAIRQGDTVLDIGCGDGLIAFGALERVGPTGKVIFSDLSDDLLDQCRAVAGDAGELDRCGFLQASADDLRTLEANSIDVVTTRSVLIYLPIAAKRSAVGEFHRVLRPAGRISLFEPINIYFKSLGIPHPFWDIDVGPIDALATKIEAAYERMEDPRVKSLIDFDERDLLTFARDAGFRAIHLDLTVSIEPGVMAANWNQFMRSSGNPLSPTLEEVVAEALTPAEAEQFERYARPLIETGAGIKRLAAAYLWATKGS